LFWCVIVIYGSYLALASYNLLNPVASRAWFTAW